MLELILGFVAAVNLVAFLLYGWDKRAAQRDQRRISERTLILAAALGGLVGAWTGMTVFRHKTRKRSFQLKLVAVTALWIAGGVGLAWTRGWLG